MSLLDVFNIFGKPAKTTPSSCLFSLSEVDSPALQDTVSSIDELSQAVHNNPDAVEIYLALGNLYRAKGELERAVHIRNNLIVRPGLDDKFKARAWYELGLDYRRAGLLDRSQAAFEEAGKIGGRFTDLTRQMARLAEDTGDFAAAAAYYRDMGQHIPEAHALVRQAQNEYAENRPHEAAKHLTHALEAFPGAPDAWIIKLHQAWQDAPDQLPELFQSAMSSVCQDMQFVLLEGLFERLRLARPGADQDRAADLEQNTARYQSLINALKSLPEDLLPDYHLARIYLHMADYIKTKEYLNRCLLIKPDFWPAHAELLQLALITEKVPPLLKMQLEFFMSRRSGIDRFFCRQCGMRHGQVFFLCPKCHTWYSVALRPDIAD